MAQDEILVIPSAYREPVGGERGLGAVFRPVRLNVKNLGDNLREFVESMNGLVSRLPQIGDPFRLDEIELAVEVNAEGNFQLVGGAKAGITGGLTLKLKRTV
jgi:hypothetical protein